MKQKTLTRKKKALKRVAWFLAVMLVVNHIFGIGLLTPRHAVWEQQEREGIAGYMRTVHRDWVPEIHATHLRYLMQNEKAVMLAGTNLTVCGWMGAFSTSLNCTTGEPLYAAMDSLHRDGRESVYYFYGRVDDPDVDCVEISLCHQDVKDGKTFYLEDFRFYAPKEAWMEQSGRQFFLIRTNIEWPHDSRIYAFAVALDNRGEELYRVDITDGASSYF